MTTDLNELRLRASLLSHYELPWLGVEDEGEALFADSTRVLVGDVRHWTLNDAVRRSVASRVPFNELHRAWQRLPHRPSDSRQRVIDRVIRAHGDVRPAEFGLAELRALAWLSRWLGDHLPMTDEINRSVELAGLLEPLHSLANESFVGRADLLAQLHDHWNRPGPPILLHGIGGIGKSATLARHVLRTVHTGLVSYLNFDQTALDPAAPATVIAAMARQLSMQVADEDIDRLLAGVRDQLRGGDKHFQSSSRSTNIGATNANLLDLVWATLRDRRVLLVLDTFEEVQRRGLEVQEPFREFLLRLATVLPNMSIVVAGRAPVPGIRNIEIPLLTLEEATWLLWSLLSFRITTAEAQQVVETVRPSPLCIRLAAGILQKHRAHDAFRDIELRLGAIEGELYHRLLGYIENPDVRKLAHPGLTLRRVTPELIEKVLARPCRVAVPDSATAHHLFEELAREAMLVDRTSDGLVHRKDVRQMMLPRLATDDPRTVTSIHRRAVAYYKNQPGITARTEELYHRLALGQKRATLERHWDDSALPGLVPSIDEFPSASKAYLATKSQYLGVSEEDLQDADLTDRAELVLRRARKLFQERLPERALVDIQAHRSEFGDLPFALTDLLVQVLESLNRFDDALIEAGSGRDRAANSETPQDFYTLTLNVIRLKEQLGDLASAQEEAVKALQTTDSAPPTTEFRLVRMRLLVYCLRLARRGFEPAPYSADELADEAARLYHTVSPRAVQNVHGLLRDLAGEIGPREPKILGAALRSHGLDARDFPEILRAFGASAQADNRVVHVSDRYRFANQIADRMEIQPLPEAALETLAEIYRQDADDAVAGGADSDFIRPSLREVPVEEPDELVSLTMSGDDRHLTERGYREAITFLRRSARAGNDAVERVRALISLAYLESETQSFANGISRILQAKELFPNGPYAALAESRHALILQRAGRDTEALERYDAALTAMRRTNVSPTEIAKTTFNRGLSRLMTGDPDGAAHDFTEAAGLADEHDLPVLRGKAVANLGDVARITADLPTAVARYEQSAEILREHTPDLLPGIRLDLTEAHVAAGLADTAVNEINELLPGLRQTKVGLDIAVAEHRLAVAEFLRGEFEQAEVRAGAAYRRFSRRGVEHRATIAALTRLHSRVAMMAEGRRPPRRDTQERAAQLAGRLNELGLRDEAAMACLLAARVAIFRGALHEAGMFIQTVQPLGRRTPVDCRMLWRLCRAELAVARDDLRAARAEARRGFAELATHPDRLGTLDLPTGTVVYGRALANLAVDIAVEHGDPALFDWLERAKAPVYHYDPRPSDEPIGQLRTISRLRQQYLLEGRSVGGLDRQLGQLWPIIRQRRPAQVLRSRAEVAERLGDRALVSFGTSRGALFAVVLSGRVVTVPLGPASEALEAATQLRADLKTAAPDDLSDQLASVVQKSAARRVAWLDEHIVRPLLPWIGDRELVISPTGSLALIAWGTLPSLHGRVVTVTSSASTWLRAEEAPVRRGSDALVVGMDGWEYAVPSHFDTRMIRMSVAQTMSAIDGAALTHVEACIDKVPDNPWFSSIRLSDGNLRAFEFGSPARAPGVVIVTSGDLGFASALLEAGVRTVVFVPVGLSERVLGRAMIKLYQLISAGRSVARAVAEVTAQDPLRRPIVCAGASTFADL